MKKLIVLFFAVFAVFAHASKLPDFKGIGQTKNGNSISLGPTGNISPTSPNFDSRIPIHNPNIGGNWQPAGNYGAAKSATVPSNAQLLGSGEVIFPGTRYPFQAGYVVPPSLILGALSAICSNPVVCVALTVGSPYLLEWLGQSNVSLNPSNGQPVVQVTTGVYWTDPNGQGSYPSAQAACNFNPDRVRNAFLINDNYAECRTSDGNTTGAVSRRGTPSVDYQDSTFDDISPYMDKPMDPRIFKELLDKGANIELPLPTITGPSVTDGQEVTTINPDGSKTVQKTKYNFQTSGNTITNTDKTTTTTTFNIDNSVRSTSSSSTISSPTSPNEKEEKDQCKENPDSVGCSELDTPEDEIPKTEKTVSYTAQNPFGGGSCPADKYQTLHTGQTLKVVDWATPCGYIADYVRPVLILLGSWIAMMLLIPGRTES